MNSRLSSRIDVLILAFLGAESQVVHEEADQSANHGDVAKPLQRTFPEFYSPRNMRIFREAAVKLRMRGVMQHVNDAGAADALRIVNAGIREVGVVAKLFRAAFSKELHIVLAAKVQTARRTRLDARRFEPLTHAIGAQGALENAIVLRIHLRNVEGASRDAIAAADAIGLLEIDDAIGILHDGAVRGTRSEAARLRTVHALVFAHQPHESAVFAFVFVEEDQVPIIPARLWHGLIGIVEDGFAEGQVVPLHARDFAGFAADACCGVNEFADGVFALRVLAGDSSGVT